MRPSDRQISSLDYGRFILTGVITRVSGVTRSKFNFNLGIGIKVIKEKLELGMSFPDYAMRIEAASEIEIVSVDHRLWMQSLYLDWNHRDPADRVIVALAQRNKAKLVTDDGAIRRTATRSRNPLVTRGM